jgi:exodeoxyribonuclease-3
MKIATFNANSIRSRLNVLMKWLDSNNPDILAIQETKVQDADFPVSELADTGYEILFRGQKKYNGVAILSKIQASEIRLTLEQDPTDQARFLKARFDDLILINTYIPQGMAVDSEKFQYKLNWFRWLRNYFEQCHSPNEKIVWVGDFNVARENIDVHDPERLWGHVCFCQEVQDALGNVADWGFVDVFRQFHPEPEQYTFWDYRVPNGFKRNIGWRLDYIMATPEIAEICTDCWIDKEPRGWEKPSDHTFLIAEFDF